MAHKPTVKCGFIVQVGLVSRAKSHFIGHIYAYATECRISNQKYELFYRQILRYKYSNIEK